MAVAGNFSAVVKIVEHSELQRELVLVGRDLSTVEGKGRVAITRLQIAKHLIVGAILFDHIDHVLDGIFAGGELDRSGVIVKQVVVFDGACKFFKFAQGGGNVQARD